MAPRLSIVVPFYNVEQYVSACLESLQRQSFTDFEVILVDDGSQDGTLDIVREVCKVDERFRVVRQENAGLGPARNTGAREAQGEYIAFVDSDDLVPRRAYARLVGSLDKSGSDLASGDARRFNDLGVRQSYVHKEPFAKERIATHVREFPLLALDRMVWNKVYRRSFWDEQDFVFPAIMYEDYPVTIRSHVRARAVDVLALPVYYWRERAGGELSITQRRWEIANLRDRVSSAEQVLDFLASEAPELLPIVEQHLLHIDVCAVAAAIHGIEPGSEATVVELAQRLLNRMSVQSRDSGMPFERVQNDLVSRGKIAELRKLVAYRAEFGTGAPVRRSGWLRPRFHFQLPFLGDKDVGVPDDRYELPRDEIEMFSAVEDCRWVGSKLEIDLRVCLRDLPMDASSGVSIWLTGPSGQRVDCVVRRSVERRRHYAEDLAIASVTVDVDELVDTSGAVGFWAMHAKVRACGVRRSGLVRRAGPGRARWPVTREVGTSGLWAHADSANGGFGVRVRRPANAVTACRAEGSEIVLSGHYTAASFEPAPRLIMRLDRAAEQLEFTGTAQQGTGRTHAFEVRVALQDLVAHDELEPVEERSTWICRLEVGKERFPLGMGPDAAASAVVNSRRISASPSVHGNLIVVEAHAHPLVTSVDWVDGTRLLGRGSHDRSDPLPPHAVLRRYVTPAHRVDVHVPVRSDGRDFSFEVDVAELIRRAAEVRAHAEGHDVTPWHLLVDVGGEVDQVVVDRGRFAGLADRREVEGHLTRVDAGRAERLVLIVA